MIRPLQEEETLNQMSLRREVCLTVTKLSRLQRFILKAAYCNKLYQAVLPGPWESPWSPDEPWHDLTNKEVAMLYYGIGQYQPPRSEPRPAYKFMGVIIPEQKPGFSRHVIGDRDVPGPVKNKARASISRAMKHLEKRGLIERFTQSRSERVHYASCNLTGEGLQVAETLASIFSTGQQRDQELSQSDLDRLAAEASQALEQAAAKVFGD
jgi:hypothetical protein